MNGYGYAASAGALLVLSLTLSPWFLIGVVICGVLAWYVFLRDSRLRQRRAHLLEQYAPPQPSQPVCNCLAGGLVGTRRGGAIYGCPVHDPEHAAERQRALGGED